MAGKRQLETARPEFAGWTRTQALPRLLVFRRVSHSLRTSINGLKLISERLDAPIDGAAWLSSYVLPSKPNRFDSLIRFTEVPTKVGIRIEIAVDELNSATEFVKASCLNFVTELVDFRRPKFLRHLGFRQ